MAFRFIIKKLVRSHLKHFFCFFYSCEYKPSLLLILPQPPPTTDAPSSIYPLRKGGGTDGRKEGRIDGEMISKAIEPPDQFAFLRLRRRLSVRRTPFVLVQPSSNLVGWHWQLVERASASGDQECQLCVNNLCRGNPPLRFSGGQFN